ncbi:MAG: hypothetical protein NC390_03570 [Fusobacterium sp.]|nr:hypothetical protein [Fusobacterium sp.]
MKRALLFIALAMSLPAVAAENYIMLADFPIKKVVVRDDEILSAASVFTLDNEKRQTILTPKVENGETLLFLLLSDGELKVDVKIEDGVLTLAKKRGLKLFELDLPEVDED